MKRQPIPLDRCVLNGLRLFDDWLLLAAGDYSSRSYNAMTISWGSLGTMWNKPFVQVVVRPSRYTFQFMEKADSFTLSAFPDEYRDALNLLGTKSGRHGDKIAESGLTVEASHLITAPSFAESELVIECKKIYYADFDSNHFLAEYIDKMYDRDYHRIYFGEILGIWGVSKYIQ